MELGQIAQYIPVLITILVCVGIVAGMLVGHHIIARRGYKTSSKDIPYECGLPALTREIPPISMRFYRVAMLFVLFDIEVIFLYAVAVVYKELLPEQPMTMLFTLLGFIAVLSVGLLHAWRKKALHFIR